MKSSGVTLKEIRRLFKALEESKSNNSMQILIDNEMCKQFQDIIEMTCVLKGKEIERLKNDKKKVLELIENDYFEDGSFENYYEVLNILKEGKE